MRPTDFLCRTLLLKCWKPSVRGNHRNGALNRVLSMTNDLDDDDLPPDIVSFVPQNVLLEIGKITVTFSFLEDELNGFIAVLLRAGPQAGQAVTFKIRSITERIQLAQALVNIKIKSEDRQRKALSLLTDLEEANKRRNTL
jgi:hypothetical protein